MWTKTDNRFLYTTTFVQTRNLRLKLNILQVASPDTDLERDSLADEPAEDNTMWARTSLPAFLELIAGFPIELVAAVRYKYSANNPSHLVAFGPHNFHLCSCLQLLRRGLPCRHYFAVLVNLIGRTGGEDELSFTHAFDGACVHNRWRQADDGKGFPWSASSCCRRQATAKGGTGITKEAMTTAGDRHAMNRSMARTPLNPRCGPRRIEALPANVTSTPISWRRARRT
ncbi:unnamed protein product [Ectocarpus sp. 8 AP-2014]